MIDLARPNFYISENEAWAQCQQILSRFDLLFKLEFLFIAVLILFVVFMLYKLYYRKFIKVSSQVEDLRSKFVKWERKIKKKK